MIVYRLQNDAGLGPYTIRRGSTYPVPSYLQIEQDWLSNPRKRDEEDPHPSPTEDGLALNEGLAWSALRNDEFCGFESMASLRAWFLREPQDPEALDNLGLRVTVWKVHGRYVRKGRKQLVFKREKAELLETYRTTDELPG